MVVHLIPIPTMTIKSALSGSAVTPEVDTLDLPARMRLLRAGLGVSRTALAKILGVSTITVNRWERGRWRPAGAARRRLPVAATGGAGRRRLVLALTRAVADGNALAVRIVELEAALDRALALPVAPVQPALLALPAGSGGGAALLLHAGLTVREAEVLALVAQCRSNKGISDALTLSVRTVERHIENLYRKIGAHSRFEATAYAQSHQPAP